MKLKPQVETSLTANYNGSMPTWGGDVIYENSLFHAFLTAKRFTTPPLDESMLATMPLYVWRDHIQWDCFNLHCVTLRGWIKEAARTLRKQDPALPENRALTRCEGALTRCEGALTRCEECFNWV